MSDRGGGGYDLGTARGRIVLESDLEGVKDFKKGMDDMKAEAKAMARDVQGNMRDLGDSIRSAGAGLVDSITRPIIDATKTIILAASDQAEALSAVTTVFGSAADDVIAFADTAAEKLGVTKEESLSAASAMGALFKGVGLTDDALREFTPQLQQAAADLGSFYNIDPTDVLRSITSALRGEYESIQKVIPQMTSAAVEAKAMELGFQGAFAELTEGEKTIVRTAFILDNLGVAAGDYERTNQGLANQLRTFRAEIGDFTAELGQHLLPTALQIVGMARQWLQSFREMAPPVQEMAIKVALLAAAIGPLLVALGGTIAMIANIAGVIGLITAPVAIIAASVAALGIAWKNNWFGIRDTVDEAVSGVLGTIGRMVQFFEAARSRGLDPFTAAFRALIVALGENLGTNHPIVDFIQELYRLLKKLGDALQNQDWDAFGAELDKAKNRLANWIPTAIATAKEFGGNLLEEILTSIRSVNWDEVKNTVGGLIRGALQLRRDVITGAITLGEDLLAEILTSIEGVNWSQVGSTVLAEIGNFAQWSKETVATEVSFGADILGTILGSIADINWDQVSETVITSLEEADWGAIPRMIGDEIAKGDWDTIGTEIKNGLGDFVDNTGDFVGGALSFGGDIIEFMVKSFSDVNWDEVGAEIQVGVQWALERLAELDTWIEDRFKEVDWEAVKSSLGSFVQTAFAVIGTHMRNEILLLIDMATWITDRLKEVDWERIKGDLSKLATDAFSALGDGATAAWDDHVAPFFENLGPDITKIQEASDWAQTLFQDGADLLFGLLDGIEDGYKDTEKWLGDLPTSVGAAVGDMTESLLERGAKHFRVSLTAQLRSLLKSLLGSPISMMPLSTPCLTWPLRSKT